MCKKVQQTKNQPAIQFLISGLSKIHFLSVWFKSQYFLSIPSAPRIDQAGRVGNFGHVLVENVRHFFPLWSDWHLQSIDATVAQALQRWRCDCRWTKHSTRFVVGSSRHIKTHISQRFGNFEQQLVAIFRPRHVVVVLGGGRMSFARFLYFLVLLLLFVLRRPYFHTHIHIYTRVSESVHAFSCATVTHTRSLLSSLASGNFQKNGKNSWKTYESQRTTFAVGHNLNTSIHWCHMIPAAVSSRNWKSWKSRKSLKTAKNSRWPYSERKFWFSMTVYFQYRVVHKFVWK